MSVLLVHRLEESILLKQELKKILLSESGSEFEKRGQMERAFPGPSSENSNDESLLAGCCYSGTCPAVYKHLWCTTVSLCAAKKNSREKVCGLRWDEEGELP